MKNPGAMCLHVLFSRGCRRHASAFTKGLSLPAMVEMRAMRSGGA